MLAMLHDEIDALEIMREGMAEQTRSRIAGFLPGLVDKALSAAAVSVGDSGESRRHMARAMAQAIQEAMALSARDVEDVVVTDGTTEAFALGVRFAKERSR